MKKLLTLVFLLSLVLRAEAQQKQYDKPEKVVITGQVLNASEGKIELEVQQLGVFGEKFIDTKIDSLGHFALSYETYLPTKVNLTYMGRYKENFPLLTHPKDSIHIVFDGQLTDRVEFLKSLKFSGDAKKSNEDIIKIEIMRKAKPLKISNEEHSNFALKHYSPKEYLSYLDSVKQEINEQYDYCVKTVEANEEVKSWAKLSSYTDYFFYLYAHIRRYYQAHKESKIADNYFDKAKGTLHLNKLDLINTTEVNQFINHSFMNFIWGVLKGKGGMTMKKRDSLILNATIKQVDDPIKRQLYLMEWANNWFRYENISSIEENIPLFKKELTEPYLLKTFMNRYKQLKTRLNNLEGETKKLMAALEGTSVKPIIDSIWSVNKGKVIYLDCWTTSCGPCRAEMPEAKKLYNKLKGLKVEFVYLCLYSEKAVWQKLLDKFQQPGQHFLLNYEQSRELQKAFGISAFPHHILVDKKGTIVKQKGGLSPNAYEAEQEIYKLLTK